MSSQLTSFARCNHDVDFIVFESRTGIIVVFKNEFIFNVQDKRSGWILCWRRSNYCHQKRRTAKNHRCRWCIHKDYSMSNNNRISFLSLAYRDFKTPITSSCWIIQNTSLSIFVTFVLPATVLSQSPNQNGWPRRKYPFICSASLAANCQFSDHHLPLSRNYLNWRGETAGILGGRHDQWVHMRLT